MNFFIVIPTRNSADYLDASLGSVLLQSGDFELHVHVQDAASTDQTSSVVDRWRCWLEAAARKNVRLTFDSRCDNGVYDGIRRAFDDFQPADDTVMTWLGSDDVLMPSALATVNSVLADCPQIKWLTGLGVAADYDGSNLSPAPFMHFTRYHLSRGNHDGRFSEFLTQEGTFWRVSLWRAVGGLNPNYKLASDTLLWMNFASLEPLFALDLPLGRFSFRRDQVSSDKAAYYRELDEMIKQRSHELSSDLTSYKVFRRPGMPGWGIEETKLRAPRVSSEARHKQSRRDRLSRSIRKRVAKALRATLDRWP